MPNDTPTLNVDVHVREPGRPDFETRAIRVEELRVADAGGKPQIVGYAAVFKKDSLDFGGWKERIKRGAFKSSLDRGDDVRALVDHDPSKILGRTKPGTLRLRTDADGLRAEIDPPETTVGRDVVESIRRGDLDGMSFGFRTVTDAWHLEDGVGIRELIEVDLFDVSVVTFPAYPDTSVAVRAFDRFRAGQLWIPDCRLAECRLRIAAAE